MFARFDFTRPRTIVLVALLIGVLAGLGGAVFHTVATEPARRRRHRHRRGRGRGRPRHVGRRVRRRRGGGVGQPVRPEGRRPVPRLRADRGGLRPVPRHHLDVAAHHDRRSVPAGRGVGDGPRGGHHRGPVAQVPAQPAGRRRPRLGGRARAPLRAAHRAGRAAAGRARAPLVPAPAGGVARRPPGGGRRGRGAGGVRRAVRGDAGLARLGRRAGQPGVAVPDQLADRQPPGVDAADRRARRGLDRGRPPDGRGAGPRRVIAAGRRLRTRCPSAPTPRRRRRA